MSNRKKVERIKTDKNNNRFIGRIGKKVTSCSNHSPAAARKKRKRKMQKASRKLNRGKS